MSSVTFEQFNPNNGKEEQILTKYISACFNCFRDNKLGISIEDVPLLL